MSFDVSKYNKYSVAQKLSTLYDNVYFVLSTVTRRRRRRTRSVRRSVKGSAGRTETGAGRKENVPAARRAKTRNEIGIASLRARKETLRYV